jgi:hypothetical protein
MLHLARPESRVGVRSHSQRSRFNWGVVDFILAVVMLPFAIWMFVIERLVKTVSSIFDR